MIFCLSGLVSGSLWPHGTGSLVQPAMEGTARANCPGWDFGLTKDHLESAGQPGPGSTGVPGGE